MKGKVSVQGQAIEWNDYDRLGPGIYFAYCRHAKQYWDRGFKRWTCLLLFDVTSADLIRVIARVPLWLNLGGRDRPRAGRRTRYFVEWIRANGEPPVRNDRLSPRVFTRRMAKVEIGDTASAVPYSVVRRVISWETGPPHAGQSVTQSHSQGQQQENAAGRMT